jgi:hypothetical protein
VYLDDSTLKSSADILYIYTDVLAFTEQETVISPPSNGTIQIIARVITADTPVHLKIVSVAGSSCAISIYASVVDQPNTISADGLSPMTLRLGPGSGNVGVTLGVFPEGPQLGELKRYSTDNHSDFQSSLQTQLRIALALFWRSTSIAISLCSHVATTTLKPNQYPLINTQAVSLGQQLAVQAMTGPDVSYIPVLAMDDYMDTLQTALDAVSALKISIIDSKTRNRLSRIRNRHGASCCSMRSTS